MIGERLGQTFSQRTSPHAATRQRPRVIKALPWRQSTHPRQSTPQGQWRSLAYVLADVMLITLNAVAVFTFRFHTNAGPYLADAKIPSHGRGVFQPEYFPFLLLYLAVTVLLLQSYGLYRSSLTRSATTELSAVIKAVVLATVLLATSIYASKVDSISRMVVSATGALNVLSLGGWRLWQRHRVQQRITNGMGVRNVLIIGSSETGQQLAELLRENANWGFVVKGFLDSAPPNGNGVLGGIQDMAQVLRAHFIDEVFITLPLEPKLVREIAVAAKLNRVDVKLVPELYDGLVMGAPLQYLGSFPVFGLYQEPIQALPLLLKRALDIAISALALVCCAPLLGAIAIAVKVESRGPALYRSLRIGKRGRPFICYKFRTMAVNADAMKPQLRPLNERQGPFFKLKNDPRVTRLGKWLRKYSLDELPQFWNVLHGDMSLVGPRPHPTDDYERYSLDHLRRLDVTPGITGMWQVTARQDPSFDTNMALDLEYIENWGIWTDLKILLKTIPAVLRGVGD